jgi:hypothetical protein
MGVALPTMSAGRFTGDSIESQRDGVGLVALHGMAYKLGLNVPLNFSVFTFNNQLNIIMAASAGCLTRTESEEFLDLTTDLLCNGNRASKGSAAFG